MTEKMNEDNMDEINDGHHFNTTKFMNYLVKNLQVLCHGHVPFNQNLEVIGHIYIKVDCSAKFNCFLNELVSKTDSCQTLFTSNSFQAQSQTENNNRTVINNSKNNVDTHFQERPIVTERRSVEEDISMPVLLKEETAVHLSVSTKENPCILKKNPPKKSNAETTLNLETAKTCISLPLINTCSSSSSANQKKVCNLSPLANKTTSNLSRPSEANISNPTQYGNIWNSLTIVNSSPSIQNDNKDSWNPSFVTKQNTPSSSLSSWSKESMPGSLEKSQCSVKIEPHESYDDNSVVAEFARSEDAILQCKKKFKTETMQTSDCVNDFTYIPTCNTGDIDEQILSDSINFLHNIEAHHKAEERALNNSINLLHKIETPHEPEEYTLSDSINLLQNTETHNNTEKKRLSDSVNLKHTTEAHHDTEEQTISDSCNLHVKHNIETHCDTYGSSSALLENINKLDRISKELAIRNIDDGSETTQEVEADCASGDNTFIEEDSDSSDVVIVGDFPVLCGAKRKFSDDKENEKNSTTNSTRPKNHKNRSKAGRNLKVKLSSSTDEVEGIQPPGNLEDSSTCRSTCTSSNNYKIHKPDETSALLCQTEEEGTPLPCDDGKDPGSPTSSNDYNYKRLKSEAKLGLECQTEVEETQPLDDLEDPSRPTSSNNLNSHSETCWEEVPASNYSDQSESDYELNVFPEQNVMYKLRKVNEDEIERDINFPEIYVRKVLMSRVSKLGREKKNENVWNQAHSCKFCHNIVTNISKHLKKHKSEEEIKEIKQLGKSLGKRHKTVRARWDKIRNEGDHQNNKKVIEEQMGEMIIGRRKVGRFDLTKYGPCPKCKVWIRFEKTFIRHQSLCSGNESTISYLSSRELRIASLLEAGRLNVNASNALRSEVFTIMRYDNVGKVAINDDLIICLGNMWINKNVGNKLKRRYYTSSRMRDTARLLMNLREKTGNSENSMKDFLVPEHFDDVVFAALQTASPSFDDIGDLSAPSTAIKLGYDIKRLVTAKMGFAIRNKDDEERKQCADFLKLMEMEWSLKVTKNAHAILEVRRFNKDKPLPDPRDIEELASFLRKEISKVESLLSEKPEPDVFRRAVMVAETRLLVYNKRTAGEIEGISVKQFLGRTRGITAMDKAMRSDLTELEAKLVESQEVLETTGKFGKAVPVIIPNNTVKLLEFLANGAIRRDAGINEKNIYLFPNSVMGVLRPYDSLKTLCGEWSLQKPEQMTSVNLRKYTATISQVFDLSPQEQSWLVNHLGHSMDIHKIQYHQTSSAIERTDIAKMMLIHECNLSGKYAGEKLSEIDLNEIRDAADGKIQLSVEEELNEGAPAADTELTTVIDDEGYTPGIYNRDELDVFLFVDDNTASSKQRKRSTDLEKSDDTNHFPDESTQADLNQDDKKSESNQSEIKSIGADQDTEEGMEIEELDEDKIVRDMNNSDIYIRSVMKNTTTTKGRRKKTDRVYNSHHPCPFCKRMVTNFSHHILSKKHQKEEEVKKILEVSLKERKLKINILRLSAAHTHNLTVLKKKKGELLFARRYDGGGLNVEKYGPCPRCLGWLLLSSIERHLKICSATVQFEGYGRLPRQSSSNLIVQSNILTRKITKDASSPALQAEVFPIMQVDDVSKMAENDSLGKQSMQRNPGQLKNKKKSLALIVNDPTLAESNEHNKDNIDSDKDNRDNDGDRNMLTDTGGGKVIQKTDDDDTNILTTHSSGDVDTIQSKTDTTEIGMKLRARNSQGMSYSSDDELFSEDCSPEFILSDEIEESCSDDNEMSDKIPYMNVSNEMVSKSPPKFQCLELLYPSDNDEDIDEEDVLIDPNIPGVYIKKISKSGTSKFGKIKNNTRVHNQYQNCDICKRKVSNFSQHLLRKHKTVDEVKAIADEKDEKKRKQLLYLLRSKYNHINNVKTLNDQKGEIILERRPCDRFQLDNYGPCPHCLSWVKKTLLWKHSRSCIASSGLNFTSAELRTQPDTLSMRIQPAASKMLIKEVFNKMNNDEVGQVAKSDTLIVLLGNLWILKNIGNPLNRGKYTSQVMRLIARFLINLRAIKHIDGEPSISSYLKPEYFEDIVKATMRTAECNGEDEEDVDKPSVLIKLGLDLKRMLNAKLALAIQNGLPNERKEAEDLLKIFGIMWRTRVTKLARVLLNERQYNKTQSLPDHSDIEKLNNFLKQQLQSLDYDKKDPDNFRLIAETVESKLMIYNRTGEIEDLRLTDYQARKRGVSDFSSSMIENCTKFEKFLLETQDIVEIRGKCGQSVPVIIPSETMEGLQFLTNSTIREQCDISRDNPYVFANKGNTVVKAHTSLSETVNLASLKSPELIISTQERKYMATITQVLDLNESQLNWVTNHTVDVHEIDNETSSDVLERMQIVKILLLQDSGQVHKYVNKSLDEIQLTDIVSELNQETSDVADSSNNMETDLCDELDETLDVVEPRKKKKAVSSKSIVKWSKEEEDEIHRLFRKYFEIKKRPIPSVCQKAISISKSNNGLIHKRTKATLKKKIFRMIDKLNK